MENKNADYSSNKSPENEFSLESIQAQNEALKSRVANLRERLAYIYSLPNCDNCFKSKCRQMREYPDTPVINCPFHQATDWSQIPDCN